MLSPRIAAKEGSKVLSSSLVPNMSSILAKEKQDLRKRVRFELSKLTPDQIKVQSSLVTKHALMMGILEKAKGVSIFLSRPTLEVNTSILCHELVRRGIQIYVPHMVEGKERTMEMISLHPGEDVDYFERDKWGIPIVPKPESRNDAEAHSIDVVLTPGVAFDLTGRRLGNGKGYYDSFFERYDKLRLSKGLESVPKYGLALEPMIVPHVPVDDFDIILDGVITPAGVMSSMHN